MKDFVIAGIADKDGAWYALGTYDSRFLQLPITADEADSIRPHLSDDRTYSWSVEDDRMVRDGELLVVAGAPEPVAAQA